MTGLVLASILLDQAQQVQFMQLGNRQFPGLEQRQPGVLAQERDLQSLALQALGQENILPDVSCLDCHSMRFLREAELCNTQAILKSVNWLLKDYASRT